MPPTHGRAGDAASAASTPSRGQRRRVRRRRPSAIRAAGAVDEPRRRQDAAPLLLQRHDAARCARRWRARWSSPARLPVHTELCQKELAAFAGARGGRRASSRARRRRGCSATSPRRAARRRRSASSTSARPAAGRPRRAPRRRRSPRCSRGGVARARAGAARRLQVGGPAADRRPGATPRCTGPMRSPAQLAVTVLVTGRAPGARVAGRARLSRSTRGRLDALAAGSARSRSSGRRTTRSTSTCARAATRASRRVPSRRSTGATRSISTAARRTASASPPAARSARSTSTARDTARAERFDLVLDLQRDAASRACTSRRRATSRRARDPVAQAHGGRRARDDGRRVREAEVLRLQGVDLRAQPLAEGRLHAVHRRLLDRGDPRRRRPRRASSRTCAWAAARARPCARRAR